MRLFRVIWPFFTVISAACQQSSLKRSSDITSEIHKIPIMPDQVFDLSGYAGVGNGNPYNLFDENAFVDPRNEKFTNAYIPVTNCQPASHPAIYFHGSEGNRIVIDLKQSYSIKEIWLYDHSGTADSCWIYVGSMKAWRKISSFVTASELGERGWKKISLDESSRFAMIRFSNYETNISEMVIYGSPLRPVIIDEGRKAIKGFTKTPLDLFLGVNYVMENEPVWLKPFHYSRLYNFSLDYDNDTAREEKKVRFNMLHYGYYSNERRQYIFDIDTLKKVNQGNIWFSIRGVSNWMSQLGLTDKDRPTNYPGMNSEDPKSYSRHAAMMWNMAAFFGYTKVDTNQILISNEPKQTGRGSMTIYENGNEEDANWVGDKYCSPYEYFAQSTADWDGDEGRLGKKYGIHNADPDARLMMSGLIGLDTNRVKLYRFLCENLRKDRRFIWQAGIQYHHYANKDGHGISPEEDSLRWKLNKVAEFSFRTAPGVKCFLGENGYDKSRVSRQSTPLIPGMSASESQGVMLLRSINATFFSGFDAYILYWLRDGNPENYPQTYLTSGILWKPADGKTMAYPGWFYISTMINRLGKYRPDKVISEKGNVWIYRYRNSEHSDSLAYFVYKPTDDGTRLQSYSLEISNVSGNVVSKINFDDNSETGKEENMRMSGGKIRVDVEEKPLIILFKESKTGG